MHYGADTSGCVNRPGKLMSPLSSTVVKRLITPNNQ
jgi:hypothetical protein